MNRLLREWGKRDRLFPLLLWTALLPWLLFPSLAPLLTVVSLFLLLFLLFRYPADGRFPLPATPINSYLLVFLGLTGLAFIISPLPEVSLPKLTVTLFGAATFFMLVPRLKEPDKVNQLIIVLSLATGLVVLAGFFSLEWPARQIIDLRPITDRLPHLTGSFSINYNEMAGTLLMLVPFVLAAYRQVNGRLPKLMMAAIFIALGVMLLFTQSRSGFLGLAVVGLIWLFWGRISLRRLFLVIIILVAALILLFFIMGYSTTDVSNWLSILDASSKQGEVAPTSWLTRLDIWRVTWRMLGDYAVIGSGLYTFDPVSRANYVYETILPSFNLTHAHNLLLQTGTSLGLSGMVAMAAIWLTLLAHLWQLGRSEDPRVRSLAAVFAASTAGYLFFNLFDTITFGQKPGLFIWMVLAGSLAIGRRSGDGSDVSQSLQRRLIAFSPLLVLVLLLLSPALPRNLANLKLDKVRLQSLNPSTLSLIDYSGDIRRTGLVHFLTGDFEEALAVWEASPQSAAYLESQGTIALIEGSPGRAIRWYDLALTLDPETAEAYFWRGVANVERGTLSLAEADFRRAAEKSADSTLSNATKALIHYRLGLVLVAKEDWPGAATAFEIAATLNPEISAYHQILGDVLQTLGDQAGAEAAYRKASEQ